MPSASRNPVSRVVNRLLRAARRPTMRRLIAHDAVSIGRHTYGSPRVRVWTTADGKTIHGGRVVIGNFTSIAPDVEIITGGGHHVDWVTTYPIGGEFRLAGYDVPPVTKGDIVIGSDVWIGAGATILSGVTIGHGAVVAARAVVAHDVRPYEIVAGNPARVVRRRFSDAQVEALLDVAWWNWPDDVILARAHDLQSPDVVRFLGRYA